MTLYRPLWAQNAAYPARTDRLLIDALFGPPKVITGLAVGERGLGANMSVDVQAGQVVIPGPLGNYLAASDAVENVTIGAAPAAGTSRYDLIVARVEDPQAMGTGTDVNWQIEVVQGTAAASPVTPDLPPWSTKLAEIVVLSTTVAIDSNDITDRRELAYVAPAGIEARSTTAIANGAESYISFLAEATYPASLAASVFLKTSDPSRLVTPWDGFWAWSGTMRASSNGGFGYHLWVFADGRSGALDGFVGEMGSARGFGQAGVYLPAGTKLRVRITNVTGSPVTFTLSAPNELFRLTYLGPAGRT